MASMSFVPPTKTEYHVCPFCGHKDFCSMGIAPDGSRFFYCRRPHEINPLPTNPGDIVSSMGIEFVFKGTTDSAYRFEEKEQMDRRRAEWKRQNPIDTTSRNTYSQIQWKNTPKNVETPEYSEKDIAERDQFYRKFLKLLVLEDYHYTKLYSEWKDNFKVWADAYMIKSMPPIDSVRFNKKMQLKNPTRKAILEKLTDCYPEKGIAGFYINERSGKLAMYPHSGIIYPIFNSKGQITCLRLGVDYPTVSNSTGDYYYSPYYGEWHFQAEGSDEKKVVYSKEKGICEIRLDNKGLPEIADRKISNKYKYVYTSSYTAGLSYGSQVGLYLPRHEGYNTDIVFGTEGEKKCIVGANKINVPFVDITGVNNFNRLFKNEDGYDSSLMDALRQMGCKVFVVAYDADKATNINVLSQETKFLKALIEHGIQPAVAEWNSAWGKGLDDALMRGIQPIYYTIEV